MTLALNPRQTALVLIDLQQGIMAYPVAPHPTATVLRHALQLGQACVATGATVVCVNVGFAADRADQLKQPVDAAPPIPPGGMPPGWSELVPEVAALPGSLHITKRQWGAFHVTDLDLQLRRRGITTIVLGGIATNFGVESTAREAWQHNYAVVIAEDACASRTPEMHRFAIEMILPRLARVRATAEIVAALGAA
ncbi:MAG: hydrolase [Opitutales bacterium]